MQESYSMHAMQLATYIMGRKYLGGSDRKHKTLGADEGPFNLKEVSYQLKTSKVYLCILPKTTGQVWVTAYVRTPITHHISSLFPHMASHFIIIITFLKLCSTSLQDVIPVQVATKWDSNITSPCNHL